MATMSDKEQAYSDSYHSSKALSVALSREQEVQLAELQAAVEPAMQVLRFAACACTALCMHRGLMQRVVAQGDAHLTTWCTPSTMRRYLVARSWNVQAAAKMLKATFEWCGWPPACSCACQSAGCPTSMLGRRTSYKPHHITWDVIKEEAVTGRQQLTCQLSSMHRAAELRRALGSRQAVHLHLPRQGGQASAGHAAALREHQAQRQAAAVPHLPPGTGVGHCRRVRCSMSATSCVCTAGGLPGHSCACACPGLHTVWGHCSHNCCAGVGKMTWLIDFPGYSMSKAPPIKTQIWTTQILQNHYPERLGLAVCYFAPRLFSLAYKVRPVCHACMCGNLHVSTLHDICICVQATKPFIDPVTFRKIVFVDKGHAGDALMSEKFPMAQMEKCLGGSSDWAFSLERYAQEMR